MIQHDGFQTSAKVDAAHQLETSSKRNLFQLYVSPCLRQLFYTTLRITNELGTQIKENG